MQTCMKAWERPYVKECMKYVTCKCHCIMVGLPVKACFHACIHCALEERMRTLNAVNIRVNMATSTNFHETALRTCYLNTRKVGTFFAIHTVPAGKNGSDLNPRLTCANTVKMSEIPPLLIHILLPLRTKCDPSADGTARLRID